MSLAPHRPVRQATAYDVAFALGAMRVRQEEARAAMQHASACMDAGDETAALAWQKRASHHEEQANLLMQVVGGTMLHREPSVRLVAEDGL
jgi:hypothetical protein